jgi:hypothetical protein
MNKFITIFKNHHPIKLNSPMSSPLFIFDMNILTVSSHHSRIGGGLLSGDPFPKAAGLNFRVKTDSLMVLNSELRLQQFDELESVLLWVFSHSDGFQFMLIFFFGVWLFGL